MWSDILTASVSIGFIGLIFRFHQSKLGKLEDKKMDITAFKQVQETINKDLKRGEKKFDQVFEIMRQHGETLARIDERTINLAKKNGVE